MQPFEIEMKTAATPERHAGRRRTWLAGIALCVMVPLTTLAQAAPKYKSSLGSAPPGQAGQAQPAAAQVLPEEPQMHLPTPAAITPNGQVVEDVVARVNDQIIDRSDVERAAKSLQQDIQQGNLSPAEAAQRRKDMLRDMIDQQLLISRGKELGINADAETIKALDEIRKKNNLPSMEALEQAARQQGVNYEDFKANIRNGIITQQVVREEVGRRIQLSQADEQAYYDAHKQELAQPEAISLSEILIPTPANADAATLAKAKAKADEVEAKIKAGDAFGTLAETYSGGPTAAAGGELGQFERGKMGSKLLDDQTFNLPVGQSTEPIRTRQGYVILKVTAHQVAGTPPLKQVEPQIQEAVYMQEMQPALRAYLTKLREEAYIALAPGFVDAGASAKQTHLTNTAYAPPAPKLKKSAQKKRMERAAQLKTAAARTPATLVTAPVKLDKNGKPKKVKREKIRFGQAPRTALPTDTSGLAEDHGLGLSSGSALAPGASMANDTPNPLTLNPEVNADDPLAPVAAPEHKTRFSSRAKEVAVAKKQDRSFKAKEKAVSAPIPVSEEEKSTEKVQAAPLGLNGDTARKKKKAKLKRKKGDPKERMQEAPKPVAATPAPVDNTVNPKSIGGVPPAGAATAPGFTPGVPGTAGAVSANPGAASDTKSPAPLPTTLPPASAPAPGAFPAGQPLSPTGPPPVPPTPGNPQPNR
jgi:peptidyl-prolyl cis-trans isomerase SurA